MFAKLGELTPASGLSRLRNSAARLLPIVGRIAAKAVLRAGDDEWDKLLGPIDEEVDSLISDSRKSHLLGRQELATARAALADLVEAAHKDKPDEFPFVVFVDELDRANPAWIFTFLESVKHVFGHPHLVFLIAIDAKNLEALIKSRFGVDYDVEGYLSKFFNYSINIQSSLGDAGFLRQKIVETRIVDDQRMALGSDVHSGVDGAVSGCIFGLGGPSGKLRRLERCAEKIGLCARASTVWSTLNGFLVALSVSNRELLTNYVAGVKSRELIDQLKSLRKNASDDWLLEWLVACAIPREEWSQKQYAIKQALGEDRVDHVKNILYDHRFIRTGGHMSVAAAAMEELSWLL